MHFGKYRERAAVGHYTGALDGNLQMQLAKKLAQPVARVARGAAARWALDELLRHAIAG